MHKVDPFNGLHYTSAALHPQGLMRIYRFPLAGEEGLYLRPQSDALIWGLLQDSYAAIK